MSLKFYTVMNHLKFFHRLLGRGISSTRCSWSWWLLQLQRSCLYSILFLWPAREVHFKKMIMLFILPLLHLQQCASRMSSYAQISILMFWSLDNVLYSLSMLLFTWVWPLQCIYFATCWLLADLHGSYVRVRMLRSSHPWVDLHFPCRVMWITPFFLPKCVRNGWNKSQNVHIWLWKIWPFFIGQVSCCCFTCTLVVPPPPPARTTLLTCSSWLA